MESYWDGRFGGEGRIWGDKPSNTALHARDIFKSCGVKSVLLPGAGYGRNALLFARSGFEVTGIEISGEALKLVEWDPRIRYIHGSFLDVPVKEASYDAIYCYNVLHLFRKLDRDRFTDTCKKVLKSGGIALFVVFSDLETSYGKGAMVEEGTYESKPGRPVHYFTDSDLREHFLDFDVVETGLVDDPENHGEEGPHVHRVRFVLAKKRSTQ